MTKYKVYVILRRHLKTGNLQGMVDTRRCAMTLKTIENYLFITNTATMSYSTVGVTSTFNEVLKEAKRNRTSKIYEYFIFRITQKNVTVKLNCNKVLYRTPKQKNLPTELVIIN